jgi:hypothetical protein
MDDYVNPTTEGVLSWRSISSCASDSEEALENWKQRLHEVSTRKCARITCTLRWIGTEIVEPPRYDGLTYVVYFIKEFELQISDQQRLLALDVALKKPLRDGGLHTRMNKKLATVQKVITSQIRDRE